MDPACGQCGPGPVRLWPSVGSVQVRFKITLGTRDVPSSGAVTALHREVSYRVYVYRLYSVLQGTYSCTRGVYSCRSRPPVPLGAHRSTSPGTGTGRAGCGIVGARKARSWRVDSATFARFGSACQQPQVRGTRHEAPAPRGSVCLRMQRSSGNLKATRRRSMQPPAGARAVACSRSSMVRAAAPPPPVAGALTRWHGHR